MKLQKANLKTQLENKHKKHLVKPKNLRNEVKKWVFNQEG